MQKPPSFGLMEMSLGAVAGALLGSIVVAQSWPDNIPHVGLYCLGGMVIGQGYYRIRTRFRSRVDGPLAPLDPDASKTLLLNTLSDARVAFREVTIHSLAAEKFLDSADEEFVAGAFAPFWDQIEHAANELAAYKNAIEQLGKRIHLYQRESLELQDTPDAVPVLHLPDHKLPDARPQVERFAALVRRAQTNFQFALIYEQRKTNQLLHAGFGNLAAAIYSLGESVNLSLTQLAKTMNRGLPSLLAGDNARRDFSRELKDARRDSTSALDRTYYGGRLDG